MQGWTILLGHLGPQQSCLLKAPMQHCITHHLATLLQAGCTTAFQNVHHDGVVLWTYLLNVFSCFLCCSAAAAVGTWFYSCQNTGLYFHNVLVPCSCFGTQHKVHDKYAASYAAAIVGVCRPALLCCIREGVVIVHAAWLAASSAVCYAVFCYCTSMHDLAALCTTPQLASCYHLYICSLLPC